MNRSASPQLLDTFVESGVFSLLCSVFSDVEIKFSVEDSRGKALHARFEEQRPRSRRDG